jgi:hypothetical protein
MPIYHLSFNVEDPKSVCQFFADMMNGVIRPFFPIKGAFVAFSPENDGTMIEAYPLESRLLPGPHQVMFENREPVKDITGFHFCMPTAMDREAVIAAAKALEWRARVANRGPFECVEVWIENRQMVEFLCPDMQGDYTRSMTPDHWDDLFGTGDAAD